MDLYTVRKNLNMGIPLTNMNLRVTDYARVSTDHLEQKKSLQNQQEHFEKYIKENPNWIYVPGYVDEGITGTSDIKRNHFMKMIEDARNGKFDLIVTKEISRFSRNTLDSIKYTRELLSYGVAVLFVNDNINTALPDSELRLTIMASMAQDEIRRLSERVKFGMNRAIERGEILGNNLLYGYHKNKDTKELMIIPEEAEIVRKIYRLYAIENQSLSQISHILNQEGITTCQGKKWCISTISRMIENPKYKGYYCVRKSEIVDYMTKKIKYFQKDDWIIYENKEKIPPIVNEQLWTIANNRLLLRKQAMKMRKKEKTIYKNRYLYSAKIYCANHHTVFHRRKFRKNKQDITWVCSEYLKKGKNFCNSPNIRESELNATLKDCMLKLNVNTNNIFELLMGYYRHLEISTGISEKILLKQKEIENLSIKKDKLLELNIQESLSNQEFTIRNNLLNKKIKELVEEVNHFQVIQKEEMQISNKTKKLENILREKINSKSTFCKIVNLLLDHIEVSKIADSKNSIQLKIFLSTQNNSILENDYEFKRGYDTKGTKRYYITYHVSFYF